MGRGGHPGAEGRHVVGPTSTVRVMMATKPVDHLLVVEPRIKDIEEIANDQAPVAARHLQSKFEAQARRQLAGGGDVSSHRR